MVMVRGCAALALVALAAGSGARNSTDVVEADKGVNDGAVLLQNVLLRNSDRNGAAWEWAVSTMALGMAEIIYLYGGGLFANEAAKKASDKKEAKDYLKECKVGSSCLTECENEIFDCMEENKALKEALREAMEREEITNPPALAPPSVALQKALDSENSCEKEAGEECLRRCTQSDPVANKCLVDMILADQMPEGNVAMMRKYEAALQLPDFVLSIIAMSIAVGKKNSNTTMGDKAVDIYASFAGTHFIMGFFYCIALIAIPASAKNYEMANKVLDKFTSRELDLVKSGEQLEAKDIVKHGLKAINSPFIVVRYILETFISMCFAIAAPEGKALRTQKQKLARFFTPKKWRRAASTDAPEDQSSSLLEMQANESTGVFGMLAILDMDASNEGADLALQRIDEALMDTSAAVKIQAATIAKKLLPDDVLSRMVESVESIHKTFLSRSDWNVTDRTEITKYLVSSGAAEDVGKFEALLLQLGAPPRDADGRLDRDVAELRDLLVEDGSMQVFQDKITDLKTTFGEDTLSFDDVQKKVKPFMNDYLDHFRPLLSILDKLAGGNKRH